LLRHCQRLSLSSLTCGNALCGYVSFSGTAGREKTVTVPQLRPRRRKPLDARPFAPEIGSFGLHLAAEGKAPKTVRTYTEAVA
jgi:hypothetical protein